MLRSEAVVIGAGIIGIAVARALAHRGVRVVLLEGGHEPGQGISSRNSGVVHAGLYYPAASLKAQLCRLGRKALYEFCEEKGVHYRRCGKIIVATDESEAPRLEQLRDLGNASGVGDVELLDAERLRRLEPTIRGTNALFSPQTGIVEIQGLMVALRADAEAAGVTISCACPVTGGSFQSSALCLEIGGSSPTQIMSEIVVNCAGLNAWSVSASLKGLDGKSIPRRFLAKGTYFTLKGRAPFEHLIYPLPEPGGLGIHATLDFSGGTRFGPDVEPVVEPNYAIDMTRAEAFYNAIRSYWPDLPDGALVPGYAGVRARTSDINDFSDFIIQGPADTGHKAYFALYGIDSPGLTAALAIGEHVAQLATSVPEMRNSP